jgi:hypothetical protein
MMRFGTISQYYSITQINPMICIVIGGIIDEDSFFEVHKNHAENHVGFARLWWSYIGIKIAIVFREF